jgi:hypothetical protein
MESGFDGDFKETPLPAASYRLGDIEGLALCDPLFDPV